MYTTAEMQSQPQNLLYCISLPVTLRTAQLLFQLMIFSLAISGKEFGISSRSSVLFAAIYINKFNTYSSLHARHQAATAVTMHSLGHVVDDALLLRCTVTNFSPSDNKSFTVDTGRE